MKRKEVQISIQGQRFPVKGWGIESLPGLTLTACYTLDEEGQSVILDKKTTVLVHDQTGLYVAYFTRGIKAMETALKTWAGGGTDWRMDAGEELGPLQRRAVQGEFREAIQALYVAMQSEEAV